MLRAVITKKELPYKGGFTYCAQIYIDDVWFKEISGLKTFGDLIRVILTDKELIKV